MTKTSRSVSIAHDHDKSALSKGQKTFNSLIKQIEKRRKRLRAWEATTPLFQQKFVNELLPLEQTSCALQLRMVYRLDEVYEQLTKAERRKVALVIVELENHLRQIQPHHLRAPDRCRGRRDEVHDRSSVRCRPGR